jgi:hypothetical protein
LIDQAVSETKPLFNEQRNADERDSQTAAIVAQLSIICLGFILHAFVLLKVVGVDPRHFDFIFYAIIAIVVPILAAVASGLCVSRVFSLGAFQVDVLSTFSILVIAASIMFIALSMIIWIEHTAKDVWQPLAVAGLMTVSGLHVLVGVFAWFQSSRDDLETGCASAIAAAPSRSTLSVSPFTALLVVIIAVLMSFQLSGLMPLLGPVYDLFAGLKSPPTLWLQAASVALACIVVATVFPLLRYEQRLTGDHLQRVRRRALLGTLCATAILYFDLRFDSDVLHNLTNAGPANQLIRAGGVPMVDAFSQYGLGPLMMTWVGFVIDRPSLNTANVVAQLHSLAQYCCVLWCMYRLSSHKLASLWLGFFAIAILLSGWWGGNYSLNSVPSSQGLRFLPCTLVVLAISLLSPEKRSSVFLSAAIALCALWSFEAFIGGLAIASLYILLEFARCRRPMSLLRSMSLTIVLPFTIAAALLSTLTLMWGGQLPNIMTYLDFALVYNMTSTFWSISASGQFLGWVPVAMVVATGMSLAWLVALGLGPTMDPVSSTIAIRSIAPLAGLTVIMSSYYVGRSVDFTLIIAFLPFCALLIPAFLSVLATRSMAANHRGPLMVIGCLLIAVSVTYSTIAVYRTGGPYITVGGALIGALAQQDDSGFSEAATRFRSRAMLDYDANPGYYEEEGIAREALRAIDTFAPHQKRLSLLLGQYKTSPWSVHTDMVLLLASRGHQWPISYVLSDELSKRRQEQILAADVELLQGDVIIVRRDETRLGSLEAGILGAIKRRHHLCQKPFSSTFVDVFQISLREGCERDHDFPISAR